jgi:4-amino-4-deoxy-L-arabinose transferase-like glycosyltransferase
MGRHPAPAGDAGEPVGATGPAASLRAPGGPEAASRVAPFAPLSMRWAAVPARLVTWLPAVAATALAATLRLASFGAVPPNPYYDAAVRSMGMSWHNFLFGAFEPGGAVSIDKPPVDLWLQVASVKLLGFGSTQLRLPIALAGIAAVPLLYATLRPLGGRTAATIGAFALAVLPIAVLTDRSDTMDGVMVLLDVVAAWLVVRAARKESPASLIAAAAVLGVAFNVKLFEALVPLPALAILYWMASTQPRLHRLGALTAAAGTVLVVSLLWLTAASVLPGPHPYPIGSTHGSAWESTFLFNGLNRASSGVHISARDRPGLGRLVAGGGRNYGSLVGTELVPALALGVLAVGGGLALALRNGGLREARRLRRAGALAFAVWLACSIVVLSELRGLHPRYVELIAPPIAGAFGLALGGLAEHLYGHAARRPGTGRRLAAIAAIGAVAAALLWTPLQDSIGVVNRAASDSGRPGALRPRVLKRLSAYLRTHSPSTRYELAAGAAIPAGPLIAKDGRAVLILSTVHGNRIVSPKTLANAVRRREVRYALVTRKSCSKRSASPLCRGAPRWAARHGTDVSRRAGLPRKGSLRLLRLRMSTTAGTSGP